MQHYRMPTRLLDWSENALVALYFAVSSDAAEDGELWALLPWELNAKAGAGYGSPIVSDSPQVKFMLREPYWNGSPHALCQEVGLISVVRSPVAIEPRWVFPRMAAQASTFTMHPTPQEGQGITDVLTDSKHLVRYVIPSSFKPTLVQQLRSLCISDRHLFPDLEGLSRMIVTDGHVIGYGPPEPPLCSGDYDL